MGPELVTLMGDEIGFEPINDDVYCGEYYGDYEGDLEGDNQLQVLGYEQVAPLLGSIESLFNKIKGSVQGGYGISTPQGRLTIYDKGLQYQTNDSNVPAIAPQGGMMNIVKNPMVLGGAALLVLVLIMMKKKRRR
jgi:hypothetical protein